ncbi:MAG TPA: Holliday junction resolvase RuvX [Steroidobacteraceae bacterium]|nr:Holliday junction resolvase RuvX [Steroidobacteraceae bacterium]
MPGTPGRAPAAGEVLLAFDFGTRRIGVAVGQTLTGSATAVGTLPAKDGTADWSAVDTCIARWAPTRLLVGLPYNMDGSETTTTAACRAFGQKLARRSGLPVDYVDEHLTSAAAYDELRSERRSGARARRIRPQDIDAGAARLILETWMRERKGRCR